MQIAQALSGYSLGEADMLRRAMGKKIKKEMDAQRARFVDGAVERGLEQRPRPTRSSTFSPSSPTTASTRATPRPTRSSPTGRLVQGEPPGGVPRGLDDARQGKHRQARRIPRRGAAARHPGRAAVRQRLRSRFRRALRVRRKADDRLCAERRQRRRRRAGRSADRGARRAAVLLARRHGEPPRPAARQQEGARKPRGRRRLRRARERPGRRLRLDRADARYRQPRTPRKRRPDRTRCSARPSLLRSRSRRRAGRRRRSSSASSTRSGSSSPAIRWRPTTRR